MAATTVLVLPGYGDSGPDHWQTLWERRHGYVRVAQDDWVQPDREAWVAQLDRAVRAVPGRVAFVAHSLGCILVTHWAQRAGSERVVGALLVAPPDIDEIRHMMPEVESFAPVPLDRLAFPTVVVTSSTDPYIEVPRARAFAQAWGAQFVDIGDAGHINTESNFGEWPEGHRLLEELLGGGSAAVRER